MQGLQQCCGAHVTWRALTSWGWICVLTVQMLPEVDGSESPVSQPEAAAALAVPQAGSADARPVLSSQRQSNASQTLCDIVRLGREQGGQLHEAAEPDPLLAVLES